MRQKLFLGTLLAIFAAGAIPADASAYDRHERHEWRGDHGRGHHNHWRPHHRHHYVRPVYHTYYYPAYYYPQPVYYAPRVEYVQPAPTFSFFYSNW